MNVMTAGIPAALRLSDATARANISSQVTDPAFATDHPGWTTDVDFWLTQIMRDYEVVRIPMQFGPVSLTPASTRNPANGFLNLRQEIVLVFASDPPLLDVMRWGISDFGAEESGDVQHFDLAARIVSGVGGTTPPEVRIDVQTDAGVQLALASLGFDPGPIDGSPGAQTTAAVTASRSSRGLPVGGIDDDLRDALTAALLQAAIPF